MEAIETRCLTCRAVANGAERIVNHASRHIMDDGGCEMELRQGVRCDCPPLTLGIEAGYQTYGGRFASQEAAVEALAAFDQAGNQEMHPEIHPVLSYDEAHEAPYKLSVVARRRQA